jgi:hypothetical protein
VPALRVNGLPALARSLLAPDAGFRGDLMNRTIRSIAVACVTAIACGAAHATVIASTQVAMSVSGAEVANTESIGFAVNGGTLVDASIGIGAGQTVVEFDGAALAGLAAELADGNVDFYAFSMTFGGLDAIFTITEALFVGTGNLPGASIAAVRLSIGHCLQPARTHACNANDVPFVSAQFLLEVSDTPFTRVPEPGTLLLLGAGVAALAVRRQADRGARRG